MNNITIVDDDIIVQVSDSIGIPYSGAADDVDLGEFGISTGYVKFDTTPTGTPDAAGVISWNDTEGTVGLQLKGGNVNLPIGQLQVVRAVNGTGGNLTRAQYRVVKVIGAQGQRLQVGLARADNDANSKDTIGIVAEDVTNNQTGFFVTSGLIESINTTGALQGETWADGDTLYLSGTTSGVITNVKPVAPTHTVILGFVVYAHANNGKIYVKVDNGYELDELHNVNVSTAGSGDYLRYDGTTWVDATISAADLPSAIDAAKIGSGLVSNTEFGYLDGVTSAIQTQLNAKEGTITAGTTAQYYRGDKTFQTLNTTAVTEGTNLYYTDVRARAAITLTTTGTSGAATYSSGTLNIPQYQAVLTNPITGTGTTNYLPKLTGASALGNSQIYDNGTNVGIGTNNPLWKFTVIGNDITLKAPDSSVTTGIVSSSGYSALSSDTYWNIRSGGVDRMRIQTNGRFGFNTTTDAGYLADFNGTLRTVNDAYFATSSGNVGIGTTTFGTSAIKTLAVGSGTAPSTSPADAFQMYSNDITAGNAAAHFRTENGAVIKLYQETTGVAAATLVGNAGTNITDTDTFDGYTLKQIVKALRNQGILA